MRSVILKCAPNFRNTSIKEIKSLGYDKFVNRISRDHLEVEVPEEYLMDAVYTLNYASRTLERVFIPFRNFQKVTRATEINEVAKRMNWTEMIGDSTFVVDSYGFHPTITNHFHLSTQVMRTIYKCLGDDYKPRNTQPMVRIVVNLYANGFVFSYDSSGS